MKKNLFFLALFASIAANAAVTVTPLNVNYGTKTVTFKVAWTGTPYNNRVWVWVDYCSVAGTSPGTFAKAVISGATATAGSIDAATLNGRGFYVTTSPSTVTATLSNATGKFNWCVYGSDAPPKVTAENGTYTLYGTSPFTLIAAGGTATQTVAATSIATSAITITPVTLTDQTGCPGIFCIYTGTDLFIDGTHLCQQRTEGAKNWEAYIKDSRDNQVYRITQFSDGRWWMANDLNINLKVHSVCADGKRYYAWNNYPDCPAAWTVPTWAEVSARWVDVPNADPYGGAWSIGYYYTGGCKQDRGGRFDNVTADCVGGCYGMAVNSNWRGCSGSHQAGRMRYLRQL